MEYYKLLYDYENDTQAGMINIDENTLGFDRYDVNTGFKLDIKEIHCIYKEDNVSNYDYIANNLSWLIVSDKAKKAMLKTNLGVHEFIPVINDNNGFIVGYLAQCLNVLNALDENKSLLRRKKYVSDGKEYELLSVIKYAVESSKIDNVDMFKLAASNIPYFVSERLKNIIIREGVKGFEFLKVKS